ncbi:hypothetical protein K5D32_20565 [Pseudomonas cichorii]|uniref:hypothetical protein n=1 Tax=Pseudomonas cichorii TaxID=36746 RepID=UPI001C8A3B10|nr:hypothetical protein [Pseudomonas cichorii]MBX8532072.1 hypothetical protein [Pseudomonas cichorii]
MRQSDLHGIASHCNFKVTAFSDHPEFFSSWSLTIKKDEQRYVIEHDGRDSWLTFFNAADANNFIELDIKNTFTMSENAILKQCELWLSSV